jgi:hypothetical protein
MSAFNTACNSLAKVGEVPAEALRPFSVVLELVIVGVSQKIRKELILILYHIPLRPKVLFSSASNKRMPVLLYELLSCGVNYQLLVIVTRAVKLPILNSFCLNVLVYMPDAATLRYIGKVSSQCSFQRLVVVSNEALWGYLSQRS